MIKVNILARGFSTRFLCYGLVHKLPSKTFLLKSTLHIPLRARGQRPSMVRGRCASQYPKKGFFTTCYSWSKPHVSTCEKKEPASTYSGPCYGTAYSPLYAVVPQGRQRPLPLAHLIEQLRWYMACRRARRLEGERSGHGPPLLSLSSCCRLIAILVRTWRAWPGPSGLPSRRSR